MALLLSLIVLLSLSALVLAFLAMSAFEPLIAQNLVDSTSARMLADSGIELAYTMLVATPNWNTLLVAATAATCAANGVGPLLGTANATLPGLPAASGTVTIRLRNDCQVADGPVTGVAPEAAASFGNDTNDRLIVESTGVKNNASRTITAVIRKIRLPTINAALAFPGVQASVDVGGAGLAIDGRDTRLADAAGNPTGPAPPVFGISVSSLFPGNAAQVQTALLANSQTEVYGMNPDGSSGVVQGATTVTPDGALTSQMVVDFVNTVKSLADVSVTSSAASPYAVRDVGSSCASDIDSPTCWGTDARPKIVYVNGVLGSADEQITSLAVSGTSVGTGILIVENGTVSIADDFQWHGPIIVSGTNVGIRYRGNASQRILGGVIVNELRSGGGVDLEGEIGAQAGMVYSTEALGLVSAGLNRRLTRLYNWREK